MAGGRGRAHHVAHRRRLALHGDAGLPRVVAHPDRWRQDQRRRGRDGEPHSGDGGPLRHPGENHQEPAPRRASGRGPRPRQTPAVRARDRYHRRSATARQGDREKHPRHGGRQADRKDPAHGSERRHSRSRAVRQPRQLAGRRVPELQHQLRARSGPRYQRLHPRRGDGAARPDPKKRGKAPAVRQGPGDRRGRQGRRQYRHEAARDLEPPAHRRRTAAGGGRGPVSKPSASRRQEHR